MVPCLDLVNHSLEPCARFEETGKDEVVLLLDQGSNVRAGEEITINYGSEKSAAEMLFSYGFIDTDSSARSLLLPLVPMEDDPLAKAKLHIFDAAPSLKISDVGGTPEWEAPFIFLMCLNEEDGLSFGTLQANDGSKQLRMHWQGVDVTDKPDQFRDLISGHELRPIFELRAVTIVLEHVERQLNRLKSNIALEDAPGIARAEIIQAALRLRTLETVVLERMLIALTNEVRAAIA